MSTASRAQQDQAQKAKWHRTTRVTESDRGTLVWDSAHRGTYHRTAPRPGAKCACGSGKAFKRCHGKAVAR